ncbi:RHS repeat-associated core domain-containing protein [Photorhabdus aballayi]|uniref:RHS repeat-associated core domain-containing protein n=1 Tax=Photorhabdus aballayi TaxID=2991723 RepID=UPI0035D8B8E0
MREILTEEGELLWAGRLLTWGEPERWPVLTVNDPRNLTCNFRFCGQYEDRESGLFYNRHRYYESETGQYLSPDPLNLAGGVNPYSYVHNPANWIDPLGLAGCPGAKPDFYVGPAGPSTTMPSTGYRHMKYKEPDGSINKFVDSTLKNKSAPVSYFGFEKYPSGSAARDGFQIAPGWSDARMVGTFDTLQLYKNGKPTAFVPTWEGNTHPTKLEPFASAYPQYGKGGAVQLHADNQIIHFDSIRILPD